MGFLGAFFCFCCAEVGTIGGFKAIRVISPICERDGGREAERFCGFVGFRIVMLQAEALIREEANIIVLFLTGFGVVLFHVLDEVIVTSGHAVNVDLEERENFTDSMEVREDITASHTGAEIDAQTAIALFCCADSTAIAAVMVGKVSDGNFKALPIFVNIICDDVGVCIGILGSGGAYIVIEPQRKDSIRDGGTQENHITGENIGPYVILIHTGVLALLHGGHFACFQFVVFSVLEPFNEVGADILPIMTDNDGDGGINNGFTDGLSFSPSFHFLLVEVQKVTDGDEGFTAFQFSCFKVTDGLFTWEGVKGYPKDSAEDGEGDKSYYNPHDSLFSFFVTSFFSSVTSFDNNINITVWHRFATSKQNRVTLFIYSFLLF